MAEDKNQDDVAALNLKRVTDESFSNRTEQEKLALAERILNEAPSKWSKLSTDAPHFSGVVSAYTQKVKSLPLDRLTDHDLLPLKPAERVMLAIRIINEKPEKAGVLAEFPEAFIPAWKYIKTTDEYQQSKTSRLKLLQMAAKIVFHDESNKPTAPLQKEMAYKLSDYTGATLASNVTMAWCSFIGGADTGTQEFSSEMATFNEDVQRLKGEFGAVKKSMQPFIEKAPQYIPGDFFDKQPPAAATPKEHYDAIIDKLLDIVPGSYPESSYMTQMLKTTNEYLDLVRVQYIMLHPTAKQPYFHTRSFLDKTIENFVAANSPPYVPQGTGKNQSWTSHRHREDLCKAITDFMKDDLKEQVKTSKPYGMFR